MKLLTSRQNPVVRTFRELAATPDPAGARLLLDGVHLISDARNAHLRFECAALSSGRGEDSEEGLLARALVADGVEVVSVSEQVMTAMSPVRTPSGLVAIARRQPVTPASICTQTEGLLLVAVDVQDPGNLGALVRVAEAGGVSGMFVCGSSAHPFSWKAVRGSMGSAFRLPLVGGLALTAVFACLSKFNVRTIAAVPRDGDAPDTLTWSGRTALLLGGEGAGLDPAAAARCDARVSIPMTPPVESLNVATAGAVLIYAARRQRL